MGILADAVAPRFLVSAGALLGAVATQLFGASSSSGMFFLSRTIEGLGAAAATPPLLAHITDVTSSNPSLRARAMSYFELSLLAGLGLGGFLAAWLWRGFQTRAFAAVACVYLLCAALFYSGIRGGGHPSGDAFAGLRRALRELSLRRLAPAWLCVNSIVGLWLGPTLTFLLIRDSGGGQYLAGIFKDQPERVGWLLLGYSFVFAAGVTVWGRVLPRVRVVSGLRVALLAMPVVCAGLFLINHSGGLGERARWLLVSLTAICIMVESGFTPAALSLLASAVGPRSGRGAAMGIYSLLLSVGAIAGSLLAGILGARYSVDGLIGGTLAMAMLALVSLSFLHPAEGTGTNAGQ